MIDRSDKLLIESSVVKKCSNALVSPVLSRHAGDGNKTICRSLDSRSTLGNELHPYFFFTSYFVKYYIFRDVFINCCNFRETN